MTLNVGTFVVSGKTIMQSETPNNTKEVVVVEKPVYQENGTVIIDGRPKKFNKISRYMLDMLTTED